MYWEANLLIIARSGSTRMGKKVYMGPYRPPRSFNTMEDAVFQQLKVEWKTDAIGTKLLQDTEHV